MKLIKCLKRHRLTDYVCLVHNAVKPPHFYTVNYILQNKPNLLKCKVVTINATITEVDERHVPVVVYYLGI